MNQYFKFRYQAIEQDLKHNINILTRVNDGELFRLYTSYWELVSNAPIPFHQIMLYPRGPTQIYDILGWLIRHIRFMQDQPCVQDTQNSVSFNADIHPPQWESAAKVLTNSPIRECVYTHALERHSHHQIGDTNRKNVNRQLGWQLVKEYYRISYDDILKLNALDCSNKASFVKCILIEHILRPYFKTYIHNTMFDFSLDDILKKL